jgi:hypothetical protein
MFEWAILCPGPSLNCVKQIECDFGCIIAVNGAILKKNTNLWVMQDMEVFKNVRNKLGDIEFSKLAQQDVILWIPSGWEERAQTQFTEDEFRDYGCFIRGFFPSSNDEFNNSMPFSQDLPWKSFTMFLAIALIIKKTWEDQQIYADITSGISSLKINIYGADMGGWGYFTSGLANDRTQHDEARWRMENEGFKEIVSECRKHNILIERKGV